MHLGVKNYIKYRSYSPNFKTINNSFLYFAAFSIRLFSVLRYESMIHEFDPYFNYRTTKYLADEGFYDFHNWFDDRAWYPLGRIIGGTIYPGLMITSATIYHFLQALNLTIDVRNVCVFLAPLFSSFTAIVTYLLTSELHSTVRNKLLAYINKPVVLIPPFLRVFQE